MTGTEISAENPGLTALELVLSPELNPFWTVAGLQQWGALVWIWVQAEVEMEDIGVVVRRK